MKIKAGIVLISVFFFVSSVCIAEANPFEIPRSEVISIKDRDSNREYQLVIQKPPNYSRKIKYPVVYMTDAFDTFPVVAGSIGIPVASGKMEPVILVGIGWQVGLSGKESRFRDYTPTLAKGWSSETGEAEKHLLFIQNQVFKFVENNYSTDISRRTYLGNSLGGLIGAYALVTKPEMFRNYVLTSSTLWYDENVIFEFEAEYAKKNKEMPAKVFLSVGELETPEHKQTIHNMVKVSTDFYLTLKKRDYRGLELELNVVESANHQIAFPTSAIQGLYWLFNTDT